MFSYYGYYHHQLRFKKLELILFIYFKSETKAKIVGSPSEVYVKKGSLLNLVCEIPRAMENVSISFQNFIIII